MKVGLGLPSIWQLSENHPFHAASYKHDAGYDALDIYNNKKKLSDFNNKNYPIDYIYFVSIELQKIREAISLYNYFKKLDWTFYQQCLKLAGNSFYLKLQAKLFFKLVSIYSDWRFK